MTTFSFPPPAQPLILEIRDSAGALVRRFSGADGSDSTNGAGLNIPLYWIRPSPALPSGPGMRRFVWDLHYPPPAGIRAEYPMSAIYHDTPRHPLGPWVLPGKYTVNLIVDGRTYSQPLTVRMDPRVATSSAGLAVQFRHSMSAYNGANAARSVLSRIGNIRSHIGELGKAVPQGPLADSLAALDLSLGALVGASGGGRRSPVRSSGPAGDPAWPALKRVEAGLRSLLDILQETDAPPTSQAVEASALLQKDLGDLLSRWEVLRNNRIAPMNEKLRASHFPALVTE